MIFRSIHLILFTALNLSAVFVYASLGITQGYTTTTTAQFSVLHEKDLRPLIFIRGFESTKTFRSKAIEVTRIEMPGSDWVISKVHVSELSEAREYTLEVWTDDKFRKLDSRRFRTLDTKKKKLKILVVSCMSLDPEFEQGKRWTEALQHKPDIVFFLGDSVYIYKGLPLMTKVDETVIWNQYAKARNELSIYKSDVLVPILGTWDDGDYGQRNGNQIFPYKAEAKITFSAFFAQDPDNRNLISGPGISQYYRQQGINFFFMDARSFRTEDGPLENESHWGHEQEDWLLKNLKMHEGPSFIIQGDQFFGAYHKFDSYERQHPTSFKNMTTSLKALRGPLVFLSGDRHLTEIINLKPPEWPYKTIEFTSSSIHAKVYPGTFKESPNPRQLVGRDGINNYGIIEIENSKTEMNLKVSAYGPKTKRLFSESFTYSLKRK